MQSSALHCQGYLFSVSFIEDGLRIASDKHQNIRILIGILNDRLKECYFIRILAGWLDAENMLDFSILIIIDLYLSISILHTLQLQILLGCLLYPVFITDSLVEFAL